MFAAGRRTPQGMRLAVRVREFSILILSVPLKIATLSQDPWEDTGARFLYFRMLLPIAKFTCVSPGAFLGATRGSEAVKLFDQFHSFSLSLSQAELPWPEDRAIMGRPFPRSICAAHVVPDGKQKQSTCFFLHIFNLSLQRAHSRSHCHFF